MGRRVLQEEEVFTGEEGGGCGLAPRPPPSVSAIAIWNERLAGGLGTRLWRMLEYHGGGGGRGGGGERERESCVCTAREGGIAGMSWEWLYQVLDLPVPLPPQTHTRSV